MALVECKECNGQGSVWVWWYEEVIDEDGDSYEEDMCDIQDCMYCGGEGMIEVNA